MCPGVACGGSACNWIVAYRGFFCTNDWSLSGTNFASPYWLHKVRPPNRQPACSLHPVQHICDTHAAYTRHTKSPVTLRIPFYFLVMLLLHSEPPTRAPLPRAPPHVLNCATARPKCNSGTLSAGPIPLALSATVCGVAALALVQPDPNQNHPAEKESVVFPEGFQLCSESLSNVCVEPRCTQHAVGLTVGLMQCDCD